MTPAELRLAAATLTGEARGRLLERADVLADLLARKETVHLAAHFAAAAHIPRGRPLELDP